MGREESSPEQAGYQRWYDQDPVISNAMRNLRNASDRYQAQVAVNLLKILLEHRIEAQTQTSVENLDRFVESARQPTDTLQRRRWYDANQTLHAALNMLRDCPEDLQQAIVPAIAQMIEETLSQPL